MGIIFENVQMKNGNRYCRIKSQETKDSNIPIYNDNSPLMPKPWKYTPDLRTSE